MPAQTEVPVGLSSLAPAPAQACFTCLTSGLVGWGIIAAIQEKRARRFFAAYIGAVLIHGIWNASAAESGLRHPWGEHRQAGVVFQFCARPAVRINDNGHWGGCAITPI